MFLAGVCYIREVGTLKKRLGHEPLGRVQRAQVRPDTLIHV